MDPWFAATEHIARMSRLAATKDIVGMSASHFGIETRRDEINERCQRVLGEHDVIDAKNESVLTQWPDKVVGSRCACQATYAHCRCVPEEVILKTFSEVQALTVKEKNAFISSMVFKQAVKRIGKKGPETRRKNVLIFYLNVYDKLLRVCKKMFCYTTGLSESLCNSYCRSASYRNDEECPVLDKCPNESCTVKIPKVKKKPESSSGSSSDSDSDSDTTEDDSVERDAGGEKGAWDGPPGADWIVSGTPPINTSNKMILSAFGKTRDVQSAFSSGDMMHGSGEKLESTCIEGNGEESRKRGKKSKHRKRRKKFMHLEELESKSMARKTARLKREKGEAYFVRKFDKSKGKRVLKLMPARFLGERCHCKSRFTHCECVSEGQRHRIFVEVWSMTWQEKKAFVAAFVGKMEVERSRSVTSTRRHYTNFYSLKVEDKILRVCKTMFTSTTGLGHHFVMNHACQGRGREAFKSEDCPNPVCRIQARIDARKAALEEKRTAAADDDDESDFTLSESEKEDIEREWENSDGQNKDDNNNSSDHEVTDEEDLVSAENHRIAKHKRHLYPESGTPREMGADEGDGGRSDKEKKLKFSQDGGKEKRQRKRKKVKCEGLDMMVWSENGDESDCLDKEWSHDEDILMEYGDSCDELVEKDIDENISGRERENMPINLTKKTGLSDHVLISSDEKIKENVEKSAEILTTVNSREIGEEVEKSAEENETENENEGQPLATACSEKRLETSESKVDTCKTRKRSYYIPKKEAKSVGERCYCDIRMRNTQCQFVTEEERQRIFSEVSLMRRQQKRAYILSTVSKRNVTMTEGMGSWLKKYSYQYSLKTGSGDKRYIVCWTMFSSTTGLSWYLVDSQMRGDQTPEDSTPDTLTNMRDKENGTRKRQQSVSGPDGNPEDGLVRKRLCFNWEMGNTKKQTMKKLETDCKLITEEERQRIFTEASSLSLSEQKELMSLLVFVFKSDENNGYNSSSPKVQSQCLPFFHLRTEAGSLLRVCRKMFMSATKIPDHCIESFLGNNSTEKGDSKNITSTFSSRFPVKDGTVDKNRDTNTEIYSGYRGSEMYACDVCKIQTKSKKLEEENRNNNNCNDGEFLVTKSNDLIKSFEPSQSQKPKDSNMNESPSLDTFEDDNDNVNENQVVCNDEDNAWHSPCVVDKVEDVVDTNHHQLSNLKTPYALARSRRKSCALARDEVLENRTTTAQVAPLSVQDRLQDCCDEFLRPKIGHRCYCLFSATKCREIEENDREVIFSSIRSMSVNERKAFVAETVIKKVKMKENGECGRSRNFFHLRVNDRNLPVCGEMFLSTTGLLKSFVFEYLSYKTADGVLFKAGWKTGGKVVSLPNNSCKQRLMDCGELNINVFNASADSKLNVTSAKGNDVLEGGIDNDNVTVESPLQEGSSQLRETNLVESGVGTSELEGDKQVPAVTCRWKRKKGTKTHLSQGKRDSIKGAKVSLPKQHSQRQNDMKDSGDLVETYKEINSQEDKAARLKTATCAHTKTFMQCNLVTDEDKQKISSLMSAKSTKERQEFINMMVQKKKINRTYPNSMAYYIRYHLPVKDKRLRVCSKMFHSVTGFSSCMVVNNAGQFDAANISSLPQENEKVESKSATYKEDLDYCGLTLSCLQREAVVNLEQLTRKMLRGKRLKLSKTDCRELFRKKKGKAKVKAKYICMSRYNNYKKRERGEAYMSRRLDKKTNLVFMEEKPARQLGERCSCKGALSCCQELKDADRQNIFAQVWSMTWAEKKEFVVTMVRGLPIKSRKKNQGVHQRQFFYKYYLPAEDGRVVRVCKNMFLSTTRLGDHFTAIHSDRTTADQRKASLPVWKGFNACFRIENPEASSSVHPSGLDGDVILSLHSDSQETNSEGQDILPPMIVFETEEDICDQISGSLQDQHGNLSTDPSVATGCKEQMVLEVKEEVVSGDEDFDTPLEPLLHGESTMHADVGTMTLVQVKGET